MREIQDLHGRDGMDADADARGGPAGDSPPPRHEAIQDAAARTAHALEFRQRVEAVYSAYDATGPKAARRPGRAKCPRSGCRPL